MGLGIPVFQYSSGPAGGGRASRGQVGAVGGGAGEGTVTPSGRPTRRLQSSRTSGHGAGYAVTQHHHRCNINAAYCAQLAVGFKCQDFASQMLWCPEKL
jgi:hypothetical protein